MKNNLIQVAAALPEMKVGDVGFNTDRIIEVINKETSCGVIVFPELSITGYTCADLFLSDLLLKQAAEALPRIAAATSDKKLTAVVGVPIAYDNCLYNCAAIVSEGSVKALIPKVYASAGTMESSTDLVFSGHSIIARLFRQTLKSQRMRGLNPEST